MKPRYTLAIGLALWMILGLAAQPATAMPHGHLTLAPQGGSLRITTYPTEPQNAIVNGQVTINGNPAQFIPTVPVLGGVFDGFLSTQTFTLTSDIFASTLGAGDFYYEVAVEPLTGVPGVERAGLATDLNVALSDSPTRVGRSFHVPVHDFGGGLLIGAHEHGQFTFLDTPGAYNIVLTAWDQLFVDSNGTQGLADSAPVSFQMVIPPVGDLNTDGFVGIADLNTVLSAWNQSVTPGDPLAGDPSGDGFVGIADLNVVLGNWNAGTPPPSQAVAPEPGSSWVITGLSVLLLRRRV